MQFGSCCCRANTSCEAKQIPNDFQKHHSHCQRPQTHSRKMLFSMKTFSTVNDIIPDMMASCSLPENTKNNDLYLVRRRDLVKTNLNTSASYLDTNSRVKCSMHSSPNIVTAHRVYPQTFIVRASTSSCPKDRNKQMPEKQNRLVLSVCPSSEMTSECLSSDSVSSSAEAKYDQYQSP